MNLYSDIFNFRGNSYHQAMQDFPQVRRKEFQQLLALADIRAGQVLLDVPSGGGYLSAYLDKDVCLLGAETSAVFMSRVAQQSYKTCYKLDSLAAMPLADASVDVIYSLAGLHHVDNREAVYREFRRVLKPDGRLVMADVAQGTDVAIFLNGFVDQHCRIGHQGNFWADELPAQLADAGFGLDYDQLLDAEWQFDSRESMGHFCRHLFGLELASLEQVITALDHGLNVAESADGSLVLSWRLRYIRACPVI